MAGESNGGIGGPGPRSGRRGPTRAQIVRRRLAALLGLAAAVALIVVAVVALAGGSEMANGSSKSEPGGYRLFHYDVHSKALGGREVSYNVIVPPRLPPRGRRAMLIFLHGRGGDEGSYDDMALDATPSLHGHGPLVVFPEGGDHGYWHDRSGERWEDWVMKEVLPRVSRRYGVDAGRIAIGGISMGGFGALDIALKNPGRFCAVGARSPALWFEGGETAPGAFDDLADFERNDVVGAVRADPDVFGRVPVWIDYGDEDPFRPYDEGFVAAMRSGDTPFVAHSWPGGHDDTYWAEHWPEYQRWYVRQLARC